MTEDSKSGKSAFGLIKQSAYHEFLNEKLNIVIIVWEYIEKIIYQEMLVIVLDH